ncbi:hypothetical protein GCM10009838_65470 [Catenulispora subtropica]|uniref:Uncharacterized protein n=2 Tax=Catenulispora subtropica TaxID=450798 RepID=A0ABP5E8C9_9ACTN
MAEETDGLGPPELDMDKVRGAGRRRRMVLAGSGAAVVLVGVAAVVLAVGGSGGSGSGGETVAAAGSSSSHGATTSGPSPTPTSAPPAITATGPDGGVVRIVPSGSGSVRYTLSLDPSGHCDHMLTMVLPPPFATTPPSGTKAKVVTVPSSLWTTPAGSEACRYIVDLGPLTSSPSSR